MLTLGDVLTQRDLRLRLVAGEVAAASRPVAGAHSIEIDDPVRWLEPDWILLTTGLRLHDDPTRQEELVLDAVEAELAAIGFGQHDTDAVPPAMLEAARAAGFPVFTVPYDVSLRHVATFVTSALADSRVLTLRRSEAAQAYLIDALSELRPIDAMLERLAQLLGAHAVFFTPDGHVHSASENAPSEGIWSVLKTQEPGFQETRAGGASTVLSGPVGGADYIYGWLGVALRPGQEATPLARQITRNAQHLLAIPFQARVAAVKEEQAARASLLWATVDGHAVDNYSDLARKLSALGLDFAEPAWVCVSREGDRVPSDREELLRRLEKPLRLARLPYLLGSRDRLIACLVQGPRRRVIEWAENAVGAPVGIGRPVLGVPDSPMAFREAQLALLKAEQAPDGNCIRTFDSLGFAEQLLIGRPAEELGRAADTLFGEIRERPEIYETIVTYLKTDLDINATAEEMHLHPNSVRYRLRRIEEVLGDSLTHLPVLVDLYLGILAESQTKSMRPPSARV